MLSPVGRLGEATQLVALVIGLEYSTPEPEPLPEPLSGPC